MVNGNIIYKEVFRDRIKDILGSKNIKEKYGKMRVEDGNFSGKFRTNIHIKISHITRYTYINDQSC